MVILQLTSYARLNVHSSLTYFLFQIKEYLLRTLSDSVCLCSSNKRLVLSAERSRPFAHEQTRLVNADLVGKGRLEGALPVVLKLAQAGLGAAALVAHPAERFGEELANIADPVVIQTIDHALDHRAGFGGF